MGNSGSVHNLNIDGVRSELNSYYQPQKQLHLRSTSKKKIQQQHVAAAARHQHTQDLAAAVAWTNSLPHMDVVASMPGGKSGAFDSDAPQAAQQFKVLPQLNEKLKLRITTNGAILLSGGTISGRKESKCADAAELSPSQSAAMAQQRQHQLPKAMQRAHTFIYESMADESRDHRPNAAPAFRRAKTLLNLHYSSDDVACGCIQYAASSELHLANEAASKNAEMVAGKQLKATELDLSTAAAATTSTKSSKINKYNKKRKAPPAPVAAANAPITIKTEASKVINNNAANTLNMLSTRDSLTANVAAPPVEQQRASLARPRLFRTNIKSNTLGQQQQQPQQQPQQAMTRQQLPLQRGNQLRNSLSSSSHHNKTQSNGVLTTKLLPYRREKSFDATLLRAQNDNRLQLQPCKVKSERRVDIVQQHPKDATVSHMHHKARINILRDSSSSNIGCCAETAVTSEATAKQQSTKIPQLKRTFYFGMNSAIHANAAAMQKRQEKTPDIAATAAAVGCYQTDATAFGSQQLLFKSAAQQVFANNDNNNTAEVVSAKSDARKCTEDIDDSGLLVHVRPTLPRRQLETPSFSPATAWLRLVEEQQFLQRAASKTKEQQQQQINASANENHVNVVNAKPYTYGTKSKILLPPHVLVVGENNSGDSDIVAIKETPIQLHTTTLVDAKQSHGIITATDAAAMTQALTTQTYVATAAAWTPQQDLGEEDDDEEEDEVETASQYLEHNDCSSVEYRGVELGGSRYNNNNKSSLEACHHKSRNNSKLKILPTQFAGGGSSAVHMFSLSLPRDVHLQAHAKNIRNSHNNKVTTGFSSLQKLKCAPVVDKEARLSLNEYAHSHIVAANAFKKATVATSGVAATQNTTTTHCSTNYRSDNWVLHKTRGAASGFGAFTSRSPKELNAHWHGMADVMEPISLSYLTGGKHVMYLPGQHKTKAENKSSASEKLTPPTMTTHKPSPTIETRKLTASAHQKRQHKRVARESLQDDPTKVPTLLSIDAPKLIAKQHDPNYRHAPTSTSVLKSRAQLGGAYTNPAAAAMPDVEHEKPTRFSFQSTVRLLEKRRLAIKLSRDAEFKEAQRKSELEAMKRVEEDFQRKRALEKANIRQQMHLFCSESSEAGGGGINELYASLPVVITSKKQDQYPNDSNNNNSNFNIYYRAEPDGAVSSPSPIFPLREEFLKESLLFHRRSNGTRGAYDFSDCGESDIEVEMANLMQTTSLVEPYLQSIIK